MKVVQNLLVMFSILRFGYSMSTRPTIYACNHEFTLFSGRDVQSFCGARLSCAMWKAGATVAMPKTKCMDDAIQDIRPQSMRVWLGGSDIITEGIWTWVDGTLLHNGYTNWWGNEPNNGGGDEDCLEMLRNGKWNDCSCGRSPKPYICQIDLSKTFSTDYKEISFVKRTVNFADARRGCESKGSRLAEITDEKSFEAVRRNIKQKSRKKYWVGGNFTANTWKWLSGSEFEYQKWLPGQPSGENTNRCVAMTYNGLADFDCDSYKYRYVCETVRPHMLMITEERPVIVESESIQITCSASAYPLPIVKWLRNETFLNEDVSHDVHQVIGVASAILVIHNIALNDGGKYDCKATDTINGSTISIKGFTNIKVVSRGTDSMVTETIITSAYYKTTKIAEIAEQPNNKTTEKITEQPNTAFTSVVAHDEDLATVENWKLEESEKPRNITAWFQSQSATISGQTLCGTPSWVAPVIVVLVLIVFALLGVVLTFVNFRYQQAKDNNSDIMKYSVFTTERNKNQPRTSTVSED